VDQRNHQTQRQTRITQEKRSPPRKIRIIPQKSIQQPIKKAGITHQIKNQLRKLIQKSKRKTLTNEGINRKRKASDKIKINREQRGKPKKPKEQRETTNKPKTTRTTEERTYQSLQETQSIHRTTEENQHPPADRKQPQFHTQRLSAGHR
jgi:hypothetical protein